MTDKYKPVPRVRMTLTLAIQNRVLHQLSQAFGIMETWDRKHEITCYASDFAYFMSLVSKMDNPPTMKQLGVEYIDVRKDVLRTNVSQRSQKWNGVDAEPEEQEIDTKVSATYKTRQLLVAAEAADEVLVALTDCNSPLDRLERLYGKNWGQAVYDLRRNFRTAIEATKINE